jgi:hypothetical protein
MTGEDDPARALGVIWTAVTAAAMFTLAAGKLPKAPKMERPMIVGAGHRPASGQV